MENECYLQLQPIISRFPYLHQFLDNDFISEQCDNGLKCHILRRLDNKESSYGMCQHLPTLEKRLAELAPVTGYDRLKSLLKGASDWDQYQETLAQIDITLWFKRKNLLREIEPELPNRIGNTDILLSFSQQDIYCEVNSPQSILKSIKSRKGNENIKVQKQSKNIRRLLRVLLEKTNRQLPRDYPGILALETGKSAIFGFDVRELAQLLFPSRPQVALIALWSWEGDGEALNWDNNPTSFFINGRSGFRAIGEALLGHLGLKGEVVGV